MIHNRPMEGFPIIGSWVTEPMQDKSSEVKSGESREPAAPVLLEGEDYYYEGPYMVFTERYHLKRGTCCKSGCRHCPYGFTAKDRE